MKDSLEDIVDVVGNAEEAVALVIDMEPMYGEYDYFSTSLSHKPLE